VLSLHGVALKLFEITSASDLPLNGAEIRKSARQPAHHTGVAASVADHVSTKREANPESLTPARCSQHRNSSPIDSTGYTRSATGARDRFTNTVTHKAIRLTEVGGECGGTIVTPVLTGQASGAAQGRATEEMPVAVSTDNR